MNIVIIYTLCCNDETNNKTLITDRVFFNAITLLDQCPLQDDPALLVPEHHLDHHHDQHNDPSPLVILCCKLIHPAQLGITVLAEDIPDHVAPSQHHPVHHLAVVQVDHLVEQEASASCSCEPGGDELPPVGQDSVAGEEPGAPNMIHIFGRSNFV